MALGNGNPKQGDRGSNWSFEFKNLTQLSNISASVALGATEATLQQVLSAIQDGQDFEAKIVVDDNGNGTTYLEVRIWNPDTQTWEAPLYYLPGSNTGVPASSLVAPIIYINNGAVLAQIYTELLDQGITLDDILISINDILDTVHLEVDDDAIAVEQELPTNINLLYGAFEGEGTEWERIQTDGDGRLKGIYDLLIELTAINANTDNVEALLTAIDTVLDNSLIQLQAINVNTDQLEALSTDIKNLLTTIDTDTGNIATSVAALELCCQATNTLLTTIDGVLDQIQTNTLNTVNELTSANVTLAAVENELIALNSTAGTLATEATLELVRLLLVSLDGKDFATETTLGLVLTELQGINLDTNGLNQETTQEAIRLILVAIDTILAQIYTNLQLNTIETINIKNNTDAMVVDLAAIEVLITASNALLTTIDADTGNIATSTANIDTALTPTTRTHNTVSATGVGSVPAGSMCGSVINAGSAAGTWNGISLPAGISIPWTQIGNRDTYGVINYDATGTTFIIEYTT